MVNLLYLVFPTLLLAPTAAAPTGHDYLRDTGEGKARLFLLLKRLRCSVY